MEKSKTPGIAFYELKSRSTLDCFAFSYSRVMIISVGGHVYMFHHAILW